MVRFVVIDVDLETGQGGRGRVEVPVADFATRPEAERFFAARRKEIGVRSPASFIKVFTEEEPISTRVTQSREDLKDSLRKGQRKREAKEERELEEAGGETRQTRNVRKAQALAEINNALRRSSGAERQRLLRERTRVSNVPSSLFTSERAAQARKQPEIISRAELQREKAEARQERARATRRAQLRAAGGEVIQEPSQKAFDVLAAPFETKDGDKGIELLSEKKLADELKRQRGFVTFKEPKQTGRTKEGEEILSRELVVPSLQSLDRFKVERITGADDKGILPPPPSGLFGGGAITAAPKPSGFFETTALDIAREREELKRSREQGDIRGFREGFLGLKSGGFEILRFGRELARSPVETTKALGTGIGTVGRKIVTGEGFPSVGPALKAEPGFFAGAVVAELLFLKGSGKVIKAGIRATELGVTRISPKFRGVQETALGEKIIKDIPRAAGGEFELGLIPKGKTPKLKVDPSKLVKETTIPLLKKPVVPKLTKTQKQIVSISGQEGGVVSGSLAQQTLVKGSRQFKDVDILATNPLKTAARIKKEVKGVKVKKVTITDSPQGSFDIFRVTERRTGKQIADLDPIRFGEEGFATRFPTRRVGGIEFVAPEARLASKATQLARGKRKGGKVITDISQLTGGQFGASALTRGAFGFTRAEQAASIGQKGIVTTSARGLFGLFKRKVPVEPGPSGLGLFGTPPVLVPVQGIRQRLRFTDISKVAQREVKIQTPQQFQKIRKQVFKDVGISDKPETRLSILKEQVLGGKIEPQVSSGIIALEKKGFKTFSSGFAGKVSILGGGGTLGVKGIGVQTIEIAGTLPVKVVGRLKGIGVAARELVRQPGRTQLIVEQRGKSLLDVQKKFVEAVELIPSKKTSRALTRVSRLALEEKEATLTDILTGDYSFRRKKPQIIFFEDVTIGKQFKPFGFPSSELEVTLPAGKIIQKQRTAAVSIIEGRRVPIIKANIITQGSDVAKKLTGVPKKLQSDISKAQRGLLSERQAGKVSKKVRKQTGLDIGFPSTPVRRKPFVSPTTLGIGSTTSISKLLRRTRKVGLTPSISRQLSARPSRRVSARPSVAPSIGPSVPPSIQPSILPSIPPSVSPSEPPSVSPSIPPSVSPSIPPSVPPFVPPSVPKKPPPRVPFIPLGLGRGLGEKKPTFNVQVREGERRGDRFKTVARGLPRNKAISLGKRITDNFVEASFKIRRTGKTTTLPDSTPVSTKKFRRPFGKTKLPSRTFVEKRKFRLDTLGEQSGLRFFRQKAQRRIF